MSETKLNPSIGSSEFLPPGYKGDRATEDGGGGVMIVTKDSFIVEEIEISDIKCETSWIKISLKNKNLLYVGSFYRQPSDHTTSQIDELATSLDYISNLARNNPSVTIFLGGDLCPNGISASDSSKSSVSMISFNSRKNQLEKLVF